MHVADIMTRKVVTARPNTSVSAVAHLLRDNTISSVPVVDDHDHVVGIISEGDLLGWPPSRSPRGWCRHRQPGRPPRCAGGGSRGNGRVLARRSRLNVGMSRFVAGFEPSQQ